LIDVGVELLSEFLLERRILAGNAVRYSRTNWAGWRGSSD